MDGMTRKQLSELRARPVPPTGNRLAAAFEICGVSQTACARATGFKPQYVNDVKNGRVPNPGLETLHAFANFFGCLIEDLFPAREAVAS